MYALNNDENLSQSVKDEIILSTLSIILPYIVYNYFLFAIIIKNMKICTAA